MDNSFHPFYKQDVLILLIRKDLCGLFWNLSHIWFILAIRIISLYTVWLSSFLLILFWAMFHWLYCFNKSWWWSSSSVTINHCSKQYRAWMTTFSTNPYFIIFQRFECSTTLSVKEVLYNKKKKIFISISKSVVTCITITVTTINNMTQYCRIIKKVQSYCYCWILFSRNIVLLCYLMLVMVIVT